MKAKGEYSVLHATLENAARKMQGVWSAFSVNGHHGLAAFAAYEAKERLDMAEQVANHLAEHGVHVPFPAIPAAICDYSTPIDAVEAMYMADSVVDNAGNEVYDVAVAAGERVHFLHGLQKKIKREMTEIAGVKKMIAAAVSDGDMVELNKEMLRKYTNHG